MWKHEYIIVLPTDLIRYNFVQHVHFWFSFQWQTIVLAFASSEVKVKVNFSLCLTEHQAIKTHPLLNYHIMMTYWGSRGIAPCIFNISTRWKWVVSFTHWPLSSQGKRPCYALDMMLGGPQSQYSHSREEKILLPCPCQELNLGHPACSLVTMLNEVLWLQQHWLTDSSPKFSWTSLTRGILCMLLSLWWLSPFETQFPHTHT